MGYWSNQPMDGDYPEDVLEDFRNGLLDSLNTELLKKLNSDTQEFKVGVSYKLSDIETGDYSKNIKEFNSWFQEQCISNEKIIIKEISDTVMFANKEEGFHGANLNDVCFIVPLTFLEWGIKLDSQSELSQYLLTLLKGTDGGSEDRGYPVEENTYPNGINTPSDFVKAYIDNWDDLISGKMSLKDIKSNTNVTSIKFGNMYNTR